MSGPLIQLPLTKELISRLIFSIMMYLLWNTGNAQFEKVEAHYNQLEKRSNEEKVTIQFVQEEMDLVEDYSKLNQIILLRHGEPALDKKGWRKRKEAVKYVRQYDSVGVYAPRYMPLLLAADEIEVIFTSTLNRSISTADQLFLRPQDQRADSIFREFERKVFSFFNLKLPLKWWTTGSRAFWIMGLNKKGIESFSEAKQRARNAALILESQASENGKALLVSHGLLNHYLVKYLKKNGWTEVFDGGKGYLSQKMLVKND